MSSRLAKLAHANKLRRARTAAKKHAEEKGKVVLKGVGSHKAFYVNGHRKTGIHRFLDTRVLTKLGGGRDASSAKAVYLGTPVPYASVNIPGADDKSRLSSYQKSLHGFKRGKYIHKQVGRMIKAAAQGKPRGQRGKVNVHPMLTAACCLLDRCGFVPLAADVGVHIGRYATEIDLVCYRRGHDKSHVYPFEIKTGYSNLAEYCRMAYRLRFAAKKASNRVLVSKQGRDFLQLAATVVALKYSRPSWHVKDAFLLNIRPDHSLITRIPDRIQRLEPALTAQLQRS